MLLHGVREEDLERERQQLARVRLPLLHRSGALKALVCMGTEKQGSCELHITWVAGKLGRRSDAGPARMLNESWLMSRSMLSFSPPAATMTRALHAQHPLLPVEVMSVGMAQVVGRVALRNEAKVSAVSPQEQPLVQLMVPAAKELAAKALGRADVGESS